MGSKRVTPAMIDTRAREIARDWLCGSMRPCVRWRIDGDMRAYSAATHAHTREALEALDYLDGATNQWADRHFRDTRFNKRRDLDECEEVEAHLHAVIGAVRAGIRRAAQEPNERGRIRDLPGARPSPVLEVRHTVGGWRW